MNCAYLIGIRMVFASVVLVSVYMDEESIIRLSYENYDYYSLAWLIILTVWFFLNTTSMYVLITVFDVLCKYFVLRFRKVHMDLERIIDYKEGKNRNVKPIELMRHILVEHDFLCWKLEKYNVYWRYIIMASLTVHTTVFIYTQNAIYFKNESLLGIITLWSLSIESVYLFFRLFLAGTLQSDEVNWKPCPHDLLTAFCYSDPWHVHAICSGISCRQISNRHETPGKLTIVADQCFD